MGDEEVNSQDWVIGCSIRVLTKHTKEVSATANCCTNGRPPEPAGFQAVMVMSDTRTAYQGQQLATLCSPRHTLGPAAALLGCRETITQRLCAGCECLYLITFAAVLCAGCAQELLLVLSMLCLSCALLIVC